jgi:outer membrane protein TolC
MLKPIINLEYNVLTFPNNPSNIGSDAYLRNNYKAGFTVGMPLFLRKERGKLRQTNIKIDQTLLEQTQLIREITNEIRMSYNDIKTFEQLLNQQRNLVRNSGLMLEGELERFRNGESSIFIINARETTLINNQLKLVEFEAKYAKATAFLYWSAGLENWLPPYTR